MVNKYYDKDCNMGLLDNKTIAIMGFGSQGHAHALNLKESGAKVIVGLRGSSAGVAGNAAGAVCATVVASCCTVAIGRSGRPSWKPAIALAIGNWTPCARPAARRWWSP